MLQSKLDKIFKLLKEENENYKLSKEETVRINKRINFEMQEVKRDFLRRNFMSELEAAKIIINS